MYILSCSKVKVFREAELVSFNMMARGTVTIFLNQSCP